MVWRAEVTPGFKLFADLCMLGKFQTVVVSQRFDLVAL